MEPSSGSAFGGLGLVEMVIIGSVALLLAGLIIRRVMRRSAREEELRLPRRGQPVRTDIEHQGGERPRRHE